MALITDQDRFFSGGHDSSTPANLLEEGTIARLLNGRFAEGAITNALGWDELPLEFVGGNNIRVPNSPNSYGDLLKQGDIELFAPVRNINGSYLTFVLSGRLLQMDLETMLVRDITPIDSFLSDQSLSQYPLSYIDNSGGVFGVGGYLVIFNYPNRPIFVGPNGARVSRASLYETPVSRMGVTVANRAFVISGDNLLYASDPLGGSSPNAPLTFVETLSPAGAYYGQIFALGSVLDLAQVTCLSRIPRLMGPSQEFLAQSVLAFTTNQKFIIAGGEQRALWDTTQFISYAGSSEGAAGPLCSTNIGSTVAFIADTGRIKLLSQDLDKESALAETYFDAALGQYMNYNETEFYYRPWYEKLDFSRSVIRFNQDRLFATVAPFFANAINNAGKPTYSYSHSALAVASLDEATRIGAQATVSWEGFYDWFNPASILTLGRETYVWAKSPAGKNAVYVLNRSKIDDHSTVIYTRGYFAGINSGAKSLSAVTLYFRRINGPIQVEISYLVNGRWVVGGTCNISSKSARIPMTTALMSDDWSISLRLTIHHRGCPFELKSIRVTGEGFVQEKLGAR